MTLNGPTMHKGMLLIPLLLARICFAAEPDHVRIDPKRNWQPIVWSTNPQHPSADVVSIDLKGERARFCSFDTDRWGTFQYRLHIPIDVSKLPIVVLRYRATNLDTSTDTPGLYVDASPAGGLSMRRVAALNEFVSDGKDQELRIDLRDKQISGVYSGFMLCVMATEGQSAAVEISEIRLEAAPDAERFEAADETPLSITVTDAHGTPVAGAKVTLDAERIDAVRSGKTDAQGRVTLTPISNESGQHMLQIDADYIATTIVELPANRESDPLSIELTPGQIYGGFIQDEKGTPIEGATVRIFAPPPNNEKPGMGMIRRAVVRTDKQGRWQSPAMPDDGTPMFKLAHPDFVCDKEYNDTPLPPIDELKSGIGVMVLKKP